MRALVTETIEQVLREAPHAWPLGEPLGFTYRELALEVYFDGYPLAEPTKANEAHVRRAVKEMVNAGRAGKKRSDQWDPRGKPRGKGRPPEVISRIPTQDDRAAVVFLIAVLLMKLEEDRLVTWWMHVIKRERHRKGRRAARAPLERLSAEVDRSYPDLSEAHERSKATAEALLTETTTPARLLEDLPPLEWPW